jgi:hypothetical protein
MNTPSQALESLRDAVARPTRGVVGLVDDLLKVCQEHGLVVDWQAGLWCVRPLAGGPDAVIDQPPRKSVFRAILARVAAQCNERNPNSVSPYGGQGILSSGPGETALFQASFANTPDEQWLNLRPIAALNGSTSPSPGEVENVTGAAPH